jgi:DNA-binding CsgD family transcriptional regulator
MWSEAEAHLSAAQDSLRSGEANNEADIGYVSYAAAQLAAAKGDPAGVVAAVEPIRTLPNGGGVSEPGTIAWQHLYIDALLDLGRVSEASESLGPMFELAAARQRQSSLAAAWALRGRVTAAGGHSAATWAAFEAAVAHAERAGSPFLTARVLYAFGRELRRAGDRRAAAERLRQARALFTELGAEPDGRRNERELAACGLAPFRSTTRAPLRLTAQELATAKLVASGLTNREVAAELVISVKTVEYHLANVFAKLGVRNRRALPGVLGLDPLQ